MKILLLSLLKREVTPEMKAARPRVIYDLANGLAKNGHEVHMLGTGDSYIPGVKILPSSQYSFINKGSFENSFYAHTAMLTKLAEDVRKIGNDYDIVHNHTYPEFINLLVADSISTPIVTTIHAQPFEEYDQAMSIFNDRTYFISISNSHKNNFKKTKIYDVVYNGIDTDLYSFEDKKGDYLLWLGRLSKAKDKNGNFMDPKGVTWAIQLAKKTKSKLILSGNVEDMDFYQKLIKPNLDDLILWVGAVGPELPLSKQEVASFMQKARCFLMTVNWEEPFGLVVAEAMSCGTPVIGFDRGAVPEIIEDGKTGYVVDHDDGIVGLEHALSKIQSISPNKCRQRVLAHFSREKMVSRYEEVYENILNIKH